MSSPGARGGWSWGIVPEVPSIMSDPTLQPTLQEAFVLGVGKAHRQVNEAKQDFRNFRRNRKQ